MAQTVCILPRAEDRERLRDRRDRNRRAQTCAAGKIVLFPADACRCWKWRGEPGSADPLFGAGRRAIAEQGVDGLLRDKTRKPGRAPLSAKVVAKSSGADLFRAAGRGHALDRPRHGQSRRRQPARHAAPVGGASAAAASHPHLQALQRSRIRGEGRGRRRPLHGPAQARRGRLDRREEPNPGARPHPARPAAQARQMRDDDPRLQAQRHDDAVRRAQRARRNRDRPLHEAAIATRSSSASSPPSSAPSRPARSSTPSLDNYATHKHPEGPANGSPIIRAGRSISRRLPPRGSTPSRASSPPSPAGKSAAAPSHPSPTSQDAIARYIARPQQRSPSPSSGPSPPRPSSTSSPTSLYLPSKSVH